MTTVFAFIGGMIFGATLGFLIAAVLSAGNEGMDE